MKGAGHSISRRLSLQLASMTILGLGVISAGIYGSVAMLIHDKQVTYEASTVRTIDDIVRSAAARGGEGEVVYKSQWYAPRRPGSRLDLLRADGTTLHRDADEPPFRLSQHVHRARFDIQTPHLPGGVVRADLLIDVADDVRLLHGLLLTLVVATLCGGALAYGATLWKVRTGMAPLRDLARQTREISP